MPSLTGFFRPILGTNTQASEPEFQSIAERDAWMRANRAPHNNAANAPAFQPANPNDPYYQRSDIAPLLAATNRDVRGGGKYGIRGWTVKHPVGTIASILALTAAGAALGGAGAGAGAGGGVGGGEGAAGLAEGLGGGVADVAQGVVGNVLPGAAGGAAGAGLSGWGNTSDMAGSFANSQFGGNAGNLAQSGALSGTPGWLQGAQQYASQLGGLLGNGGGGGGYFIPQGILGGGYAPPQQQRRSSPLVPLSTQTPQYVPTRGYTPNRFYGATIWT